MKKILLITAFAFFLVFVPGCIDGKADKDPYGGYILPESTRIIISGSLCSNGYFEEARKVLDKGPGTVNSWEGQELLEKILAKKCGSNG